MRSRYKIVAARPILGIYGSGYEGQTPLLLSLLAVGDIPLCLLAVVLTLDRIDSRVSRATLTRLALAVLVIGGSWVLLKRVGVVGVGLAWVGGNLIMAITRLPTIAAAVTGRPAAASWRGLAGRRPAEPGSRGKAPAHRAGLRRFRTVGRHVATPPGPRRRLSRAATAAGLRQFTRQPIKIRSRADKYPGG